MDLEVISTDGVLPNDRLAYWNENAGSKIAPVVAQQLGGTSFNASLLSKKMRSFELMQMRSTPAYVRTEAGQFDPGMINLTLLRRGRILSRTAGVDAELGTSDMIIFDPDKPMEVTFPIAMDLLILRLPLVDMEQHLPRLRQMTGRKLCGSEAGGAIFSRFLSHVWDQFLKDGDGEWLDAVGSAIWPMLEVAYSSEFRTVASSEGASVERRNALIRIAESRLCNPELNTEMLAQSLNMTPRNVQILFAQMGLTPTTYIRNRRLDLAAHMLSTGKAGASITDVCYDVGFGDLSSFCRVFRKRFGVAPSQYRLGLRRSSGPSPKLSS